MLVNTNPIKEKEAIEELISTDDALRRQHDLFVAEMAFKQELINIRKAKKLTQAELGKRAGLSQQAVSRLEKGQGATIETVIKYLASMGYALGINRSKL